MASFSDVERQARRLTAAERAMLVEHLLESLQSPLSEIQDVWAEEIERRVAAFEEGTADTWKAEDVLAEARYLIR